MCSLAALLTKKLSHAVSQVVLFVEGVVARGVLDVHIQPQHTSDLQTSEQHLSAQAVPTHAFILHDITHRIS